MDLANYSRSLSQMLTHEIYRDCHAACLSNEQTNSECTRNCSSKHAQLLSKFEQTVKLEIPRLQELSRIQ